MILVDSSFLDKYKNEDPEFIVFAMLVADELSKNNNHKSINALINTLGLVRTNKRKTYRWFNRLIDEGIVSNNNLKNDFYQQNKNDKISGFNTRLDTFVTDLSQICHTFVTYNSLPDNDLWGKVSQICHRFVTLLSQNADFSNSHLIYLNKKKYIKKRSLVVANATSPSNKFEGREKGLFESNNSSDKRSKMNEVWNTKFENAWKQYCKNDLGKIEPKGSKAKAREYFESLSEENKKLALHGIAYVMFSQPSHQFRPYLQKLLNPKNKLFLEYKDLSLADARAIGERKRKSDKSVDKVYKNGDTHPNDPDLIYKDGKFVREYGVYK